MSELKQAYPLISTLSLLSKIAIFLMHQSDYEFVVTFCDYVQKGVDFHRLHSNTTPALQIKYIILILYSSHIQYLSIFLGSSE